MQMEVEAVQEHVLAVKAWQRHDFLLTLAFANPTLLRGRTRLWVC